MPKEHLDIHVIMATFNGEKFVKEQLNSIIDQDHPISSIKVFDDVSTDSTLKVLKETTENQLIKLQRNSTNLGLIENFKLGIESVTGDVYIALSDQDDIWLPSKLSTSAKKMKEIEEDRSIPCLVYSDLSVINEENRVIARSFWDETGRGSYNHCLETVIYGNVVNGCTTLMNKALAEYAKDIPDGVSGNHDAWLALVAFTFGRVGTIQEPTVLYRQHANNITYNTSHKKLHFRGKLEQHVAFALRPNNYLKNQLSLAEAFFQAYRNDMNGSQVSLFKEFLNLKGKNYLKKKRSLWKAFKPHWHKPRLQHRLGYA